jgi:hypothetical protein
MTRPPTQRSGAPPPDERNGGAAYPAAPETSHHLAADHPDGSAYPHHGEQIRSAVPDVSGFAAAPAGRRTRWAIIVPRCVWCSGLHIHRALAEHGGIRTGSCGKAYRVVLAGNKRGRWAS